MAFLGLSLVAWQTLLIIIFPLIYGSFSRIKQVLLFLRAPFKRAPPDSNKTNSPPVKKFTFRHLLTPSTLLLGIQLFLFTLYFSLNNPSQYNLFILTKQPLNIPSTTLATALTRYYRTRGLPATPIEQERLLRKLNTLDSRLLYATVGPDAFLNCIWCRPPSNKNSSNGTDHLLYTLTRLGFNYSVLLISLGLMTTGGPQLNAKRRIWRSRLAMLSVVYLIFETSLLTTIVFIPALLTSMDSSRMIWDSLFGFRFLFFCAVLLAAWWSVITEVPKDQLPAFSKLGIGIVTVAAELDGLVNRLRLAALQRSAVMRDGNFRTQTNQFWENAESQAEVAASNEAVQSSKDSLGLSIKHHQNRDELRSWIQQIYPNPSSTTQCEQVSSPSSL